MITKPRLLVTRVGAFTLLELLTALVIVSILATMALGAVTSLQRRADYTKCVSNLTNLYAATNVYLQENQSWPQIDYTLIGTDEASYAKAWMEKLRPFGLSQINWLCPTVQRELNTDIADPQNLRVDYIASPFDERPAAPFEYPTQPWFAERGDPHEKGNLVILTNGQVYNLRDLLGVRSK